MFLEKQWNLCLNADFGFMNIFNESLKKVEIKRPNSLPNLRQGATILVASDYSGQHNKSLYESFSFLFADLDSYRVWEKQRCIVRQKFLFDNRRMSYKNLNDKKRKQALIPFLNVANSISGIVVTILIQRKIRSLFKEDGYLDMADPELQKYKHWNKNNFEKLLRIIHFISFFIAGLSRSKQNILWITDEDEIMSNEKTLKEAGTLFAHICSHYLSHNLGHFRWGTTRFY